MKDYEIVIDCTCDLNEEVRKQFGLYNDYFHGIIYIPGREDKLSDLSYSDIKSDEYYALIKKHAGKVRTAFATFEEFSRVVKPILESDKDIIVVTISSALSGTYNGYLNYAKIILEDYPGARIEVVDSLKYASASGLVAIYAALNKQKGMSLDDNLNSLSAIIPCIHEIGPMDDLFFLAKNGRIAAPKAFFGQLAGVQPVADFTRDGKSMPLGTIKGSKNVDKFCLEYLLKTIKNPEEQVVIVAHSNRLVRAKRYKEQLEKALKVKQIIIHEVAQSCAPNIGPGLCVYFYVGDEISLDREKENKLYSELKANL